MRLGLTGDGIVQGFFERFAIAFGVLPEPLVVSFWGMAAARSFIVGGNLGVFEALRDGPKTAKEVAHATGCDPGGMETLLNSMNGFGFLRRGGGKYSNVKSVKWFVKPDPTVKQEFFPPAYDLISIFKWARRSSFSMHDIMPFFADIWDLMGGMEQAVRTGNPSNFHHENRPPEFWERYLRTLATFARLASVEIIRKIEFSAPPKRLLDVGGGHGAYSAAFCHRYSGLQAEILDLPQAAQIGRKILAELGKSDCVTYREGDLRHSDWGENGYDGLLLFNLVHTLTPPEAQEALVKARRALRPGGTLIIFDSAHEGGTGNLSASAGFNELFFYIVAGGAKAYPEATLLHWMTEAGYKNARKLRLRSVPLTLLLTASA